MRVLSYDCFSGISGDMNLGAMLDLGIERDYLVKELKKLNLSGWEFQAEKDQRHGIMGTRVTIAQTGHHHAHRRLADIENILKNSDLTSKIKEISLKIFKKIADAEAHVHGIPVNDIHFHEVGAIDSIIDITGAAICYDALNVDAVHVSEIELGSGFVKCEHGSLPVPAPATTEIIKGIPVKKGGVDFEATTPTGAAIISTLGTVFSKTFSMKIEKTGYGVGQKDHPDVPNLLRVSIGEITGNTTGGHDALLISCNIDDMNPEFCEYISEKLFNAGAQDISFSNIIMKKGRPGIVINVICETEIGDTVKEILFTESTTLGIRTIPFRKDTLSRELITIPTVFGNVIVKRSFYKGKIVSWKPEYEECKRIAREKGIPVKEVHGILMSYFTEKNR